MMNPIYEQILKNKDIKNETLAMKEYKELLFAKFEYDKAKRSRFLRFLLAIDQLFNVLLFNGSQDETISSHIGRKVDKNQANWFEKTLGKFLNIFEKEHIHKSKGE